MPTDRRQTLGQFLRTQREKLSPSQAGLLVVPHRRRTPGLRREEAAQLCGISTTWYTWLEQGRDVTCSPTTLSRIATALQMSSTERRYLFTLTELRDPHQITPSSATPDALLNLPGQIKSPAYLLDPLWNVLSANDPARDLFTNWMTSPEPNQLRYVFLNPEARTFLTDWPDRSRRLLAEFRADTAHLARTTVFQALTSALQAESQEFLHFWQDQRVLPREGGQRSFQHPVLGLLKYEQITLTPAEHAGYKLVILTPNAIEQNSAS